jgi:nicotinate-nucleotide pyrophosphorylase (carboxylating)
MISLDYLLQFIDEDAPFGDITSDAIIPNVSCTADIRAEDGGIIAGIDEITLLFSHFGVEVHTRVNDGDMVRNGDVIVSLSGEAKMILLVERTALNILGRMSGIATRTKKMVTVVSSVNPRCRVAATRKTCPGFRELDKKAVVIGGGEPHRFSLSDSILIKDNHLVLVPLENAIAAAKKFTHYKKIEVEAETPEAAHQAGRAGADIIMLDNMNPEQIRKTISLLKSDHIREHVVIELSGGIDENTLRTVAAFDVDVISMGSLTHTVKNFSVTLEINP